METPHASHRPKEELLAELSRRRTEFSAEEVLRALGEEKNLPSQETSPETAPSSKEKRFTRQKVISSVAYSIGSLIVIIGVVLLGIQFWADLGPGLRVAVTLGLGLVTFMSVVLLEHLSRTPRVLKESLSVIAATLTVFGGFVASGEVLNLPFTAGVQASLATMLTAMFGGLYMIRASGTYLFFALSFGVWILYALFSLSGIQQTTHAIMDQPGALYAYLTSLIGLGLLLLAYFLSTRVRIHPTLSLRLYSIGAFALTIPLFVLGKMYNTLAWDIVGLVALIGLAGAGARLNKVVLTVSGGLVLVVHIFSSFYFIGPFVYMMWFGWMWGILGFGFFLLLVWSIFRDRGPLPHILLALIATTWLFYVVLSLDFIQQQLAGMEFPTTAYIILTSLVGLGYIMLGYYFSEILRILRGFSGLLFVVGSFCLVVPLFSLSFIYTGAWDLLSIITIGGITTFGVYLQRKSLIVSGGILLATFVLMVSFRYFADTIGWPFALIIAGFLLMFSGYISYTLFSRFSREEEVGRESSRALIAHDVVDGISQHSSDDRPE